MLRKLIIHHLAYFLQVTLCCIYFNFRWEHTIKYIIQYTLFFIIDDKSTLHSSGPQTSRSRYVALGSKKLCTIFIETRV